MPSPRWVAYATYVLRPESATADTPEAASNPRRRPGDRRARILSTAAALFVDRGYDAVTMQQLADDVGVTAGALYRHFSSKTDLLFELLQDLFTQLGQPTEQTELHAVLRERAVVATRNPVLGRLWASESRHLPAHQHAEFERRLTREAEFFAGLVRRERADLSADGARALARAISANLASPSGRIKNLTDQQQIDVLVAGCLGIAAVDLAEVSIFDGPPPTRHLVAQSRRQRVLSAASDAFVELGYERARLSDIADAAGITGPSLYGYFDSKRALLDELLIRGESVLWSDAARILRTTADPRAALQQLVGSYVAVGIEQPQTVVGTTRLRALLHDDVNTARDYVREWTALLEQSVNGIERPIASARVQSALHIVNHLSLERVLRRDARWSAEFLNRVALAVLLPA